MQLPPGRIRAILLLAAFVISACARDEARPVTCRTHKVSNGELTECD